MSLLEEVINWKKKSHNKIFDSDLYEIAKSQIKYQIMINPDYNMWTVDLPEYAEIFEMKDIAKKFEDEGFLTNLDKIDEQRLTIYLKDPPLLGGNY